MPEDGYVEMDVDEYFLRDRNPRLAKGVRSDLRYVNVYLRGRLTPLGPKGIDPGDYVTYAKSDLESGGFRGAINAVSNAKRAIHLSLECFFDILGLGKAYKKSNFPTKLDLVHDLEAFPTRLLRTLNDRRNVIEHDYEPTDIEEAADLVDIAEMFNRLCIPFTQSMVVAAHVGLVDDERDLEWRIDYDRKELLVIQQDGALHTVREPIGKIYLSRVGSYKSENIIEKMSVRLIERIPLTKGEKENWLPILNSFVYCAKEFIHFKRSDRGPHENKDHEERSVMGWGTGYTMIA